MNVYGRAGDLAPGQAELVGKPLTSQTAEAPHVIASHGNAGERP